LERVGFIPGRGMKKKKHLSPRRRRTPQEKRGKGGFSRKGIIFEAGPLVGRGNNRAKKKKG